MARSRPVRSTGWQSWVLRWAAASIVVACLACGNVHRTSESQAPHPDASSPSDASLLGDGRSADVKPPDGGPDEALPESGTVDASMPEASVEAGPPDASMPDAFVEAGPLDADSSLDATPDGPLPESDADTPDPVFDPCGGYPEEACRQLPGCIWADPGVGVNAVRRCHTACDGEACPDGMMCDDVDVYPPCDPFDGCVTDCPERGRACVPTTLMESACIFSDSLCTLAGPTIEICTRQHLPGVCSITIGAPGCIVTAGGFMYAAPILSFREYLLHPGWRYSGDDYRPDTLTHEEHLECLSLLSGCEGDAG